MHRVVIIGGGFAGLSAAQALKNAPVDVTVIDRRNFHLFQPLLYQVATGALSPGEIASPIRNVLRKQKNTRVWLGEVVDIDVVGRGVLLKDGSRVAYDTLIVATGATHSYFGHPEWEEFAPGLKTIEDATEIRKKILFAFEAAERETDAEKRQAWLTFVLVGGGPTGVELAGALAEISNDTLRHDFRAINPRDSRIIIVEGSPRLLLPFPEDLSKAAEDALRRMRVQTRTHTMVTSITGDGVTIKCGDKQDFIPAKTVLWAAGVRASDLGKLLAEKTGAPLARAGQVVVEPDCTIKNYPEIFVVGDLQSFTHQTGKPLPGVAQPAMQGGAYVGKTIIKRLRGESVQPFKYWDKGNMAVIGRLAGVADLHKIHLHGPLAWFAWLFIHILYLVGFDNRLTVLTEWAFDYFTHNRSARLITGVVPPLPGADVATSSETDQQAAHV